MSPSIWNPKSRKIKHKDSLLPSRRCSQESRLAKSRKASQLLPYDLTAVCDFFPRKPHGLAFYQHPPTTGAFCFQKPINQPQAKPPVVELVGTFGLSRILRSSPLDPPVPIQANHDSPSRPYITRGWQNTAKREQKGKQTKKAKRNKIPQAATGSLVVNQQKKNESFWDVQLNPRRGGNLTKSTKPSNERPWAAYTQWAERPHHLMHLLIAGSFGNLLIAGLQKKGLLFYSYKHMNLRVLWLWVKPRSLNTQ